MDFGLHNKRALVCGSTQGIGLASAKILAAEGAQVTLIARNEEKLKAACAALTGEGHDCLVAVFPTQKH